MHATLRFAILFVVVLLTAVGCANDERSPAGGSAANSMKPQAVEEFNGPPRVNADAHFASAQLIESRALTPLPNGKMPDARQQAAYRAAAVEQYAQALKLDPAHAASLYRTAVLHTELKRYDRAVATWRRYVEATGRTPNGLTNLGLAQELAGRPREAEESYAEAARIDPAHKPSHVNLGMLLAKQGRLQPAQAALSAVLPPASVHWHLGVALQAAGRAKEADQQFRAAASLDPAYAKRPSLPLQSMATTRD